jgi:mannose-6-phosphate isomerase-like protein (cupin superfamily)
MTLDIKKLQSNYDYPAPDGSEIRLLSQANNGGLCHCTLPPGIISSAVKHKTVEEIWYCLSGNGQVWRKLGNAEETVDVMEGVSLTIPVDAHFQFRNTSDKPFCFLIATMPPWPGKDEAIKVRGYWQSIEN